MVIMINLSPRGAPYQLTVLVLLTLPAAAIPADWNLLPSLRLRESYTDNMHLEPDGQARGEWTPEVTPGLSVTASGPRLNLRLDYALQKVSYTREPDRTNQQLDVSGHGDLVQDWLYLDAHSSISQQNISAFGPQQIDSTQNTGNSTTVRATSVTPYLQHYFPGLATATLRSSWQHVTSGHLISVRSDDTSLLLNGDNGGQGWNWALSADRNYIDDAALAPVTMNDATLTLSFPLNGRFALIESAGYEKDDYHAIGTQPQGKHWSSGLRWTPSPRTSLSASVGRRYFGKTSSLDAAYRLRSMFWTLDYSVDITTTHGQFLSVPPAGLSDFLDQLWASRIPDAETRLRTIKVFLALSQLLGPDGNVNFFSHRYYLERQWKLAGVYSTPRSALAINFATIRRQAETSNLIDSPLLGTDSLALDDHTRQRALQLGWNWRMSGRDNLTLAASRNIAQSLDTGRSDRNLALTLGMTRQLSAKVSATIDARHIRHTSSAGGNYRENGAGVMLSMQF